LNTTAAAVATAAVFVWLGMVLAISFLEAPLKFRAPGVTVPVGLGIGRIVFRALNRVEIVLAAVTLAAVVIGRPSGTTVGLTAAIVIVLPAQLIGIRPRLNRRSDRVLAGENLPRSTVHLYYVALEGAKVIALAALGVCLLMIG
jgi:hypothetical protein